MYVGLTALLYSDFFLAALGCYVNPRARTLDPAGDYLWNVLCCFSLLGLPVLLLHLAGYVFLPPVWPEHFPDRDKALEELGGKLYFRFHRRRRGNPNAARRAVEVAVEVLSRTLPSTLWEVEVITEDDTSRLASANIREFVLPPDRVASAAAWTRGDGNRDDDGVGACELLSYGVERSTAGWGDWVVHMGADAILNQRAVDAVVAHAARESRLVALSPASKPRSRRAAQGAVLPGITRTANAVEGGVPTMFAWIPAMAEVVRAGENVGLTRLAYTRQTVTSPVPNAFLVVPNELERSVGWPTEYTPPGTEMTSFALRCQDKGARFAWLDAGVHAPVTPGAVALFRSRVRDHAGALLLMGEDVALSAQAQIFLGLTCVSAGFATLAPVLTAAAPFITHEPGPEAFAVATAVGACSALARCKYAVGFYVSSGARHLARGAPGYVLYCILFAITLSLVPAFSLFEFAAMCAAPFAAPSPRGRGEDQNRTPRRILDVVGVRLGRVSPRIGRGSASMGGARKGGEEARVERRRARALELDEARRDERRFAGARRGFEGRVFRRTVRAGDVPADGGASVRGGGGGGAEGDDGRGTTLVVVAEESESIDDRVGEKRRVRGGRVGGWRIARRAVVRKPRGRIRRVATVERETQPSMTRSMTRRDG